MARTAGGDGTSKRRGSSGEGITLAVAAVAATGYVVSTRANGARYRTAQVDRGPIAVTVSATSN